MIGKKKQLKQQVRDLQIKQMRLDGDTLEEIGQKFGMTRSGVSKALKRLDSRQKKLYNSNIQSKEVV